ncbi:MAG: LemA family protein [Pseudomonadota bacterium]
MTLDLVFLFGLILLLIGGVVHFYNRFVRLRHDTRAAWSDISVQLKLRHELIPKLVEAVQAYARFEQLVHTATAQQRADLEHAPVRSVTPLEQSISADLNRLRAVAEAYPELKSSERFAQLMAELSAIEDRIQYARRYYNGCARELNVLRESFPANLIGSALHIEQADYFQLDSGHTGENAR